MFEKLFKKNVALADIEPKLLLAQLKAMRKEDAQELQEELTELVSQHADKAIKMASIDRLSDFEKLAAILHQPDKELALRAISRITKDEQLKSQLQQNTDLQKLPMVQNALVRFASSIAEAKSISLSPDTDRIALCLDCSSSEVRGWLAEQITDEAQLLDLEKASRNRDKRTNRLARERLNAIREAKDYLQMQEKEYLQLQDGLQALEAELISSEPLNSHKLQLTTAALGRVNKVFHDLESSLKTALVSKQADTSSLNTLINKCTALAEPIKNSELKLDGLIKEQARLQAERDLIQQQEQEQRQQAQHLAEQQRLEAAKQTESANAAKLLTQQEQQQRQEQKQDNRKALEAQLSKNLDKLELILAEGNMNSASGLYSECRSKSKQLPQPPNSTLLNRFKALDKKYSELRDWQAFAAKPKQIELCEAVEKLADNPEQPEEQIKSLKSLRDSWHALGRANKTLIKRFDDAAERAFQPCKIYFETQKKVRKDNLTKRQSVFEQMTAFIENNDWPKADWKAVEKLLRTARSEWNSYVPIERSKLKTLQKDFDHVCEQIHQKISARWKINLDLKQKYLDRASELVSLDAPLSIITDEAKTLQRLWREVGNTNRNQDQRLWHEFRKQSDLIFARRDEEKKALQEQKTQLTQALSTEYEKLAQNIQSCESALRSRSLSISSITEAERQYRELSTKVADAPKPLQEKISKLGPILKNLKDMHRKLERSLVLEQFRALDEKLIGIEQKIHSGELQDQASIDACLTEFAIQFQDSMSLDKCSQRVLSVLNTLGQTDSSSVHEKACKEQTELVVRAEIESGLESTEQDQALRMQLQVERLKSSLSPGLLQKGEHNNKPRDPNSRALEWCQKPGYDASRETLSARFFTAMLAI